MAVTALATFWFDSIKRKGYEGEAFRKAHVRACLIAAVCLAIVYGGLLYMGACVSTEYTPDSISNANLLLAIIRSSGGQIAIYGLCLSVVLACLTTAISQITAVADFYETATHGKLSYKVLVMIVPIVTTIVASFGLDTIVSLTSPWFSFFYPITLVMTILGIFEKKIPNDGAFKGAVYFTVIYAVLDLPHENGFGFLDFFVRFLAVLYAMEIYDIIFFDWVLLCHSNFFPHFYPELKGVVGPHMFGSNKRTHIWHFVIYIPASAVAAWLCALL